MSQNIKLLFIFLLIGISNLYSFNERISARNVGMGRTFVASSRGLDALGLNPANLALHDRKNNITFHFTPIGFHAGSDFLDFTLYRRHFTGTDTGSGVNKKTIAKTLTPEDKSDILSAFPGGISTTQIGLDLAWFGIASQINEWGYGLTITEHINTAFDLTSGYMRLALNGLEEDGSNYDFNGTAVNASWLRMTNFSIAYKIPELVKNQPDISVGVGIKYVQGISYYGTKKFSGYIKDKVYKDPTDSKKIDSLKISAEIDFLQYQSLITDFNDINEILLKPPGSGFGFDFGISIAPNSKIRLGMSVINLGSVKWSKNTQVVSGKGKFNISDIITQATELREAFKGETKDTSSFTTQLPTQLHFGAEFNADAFKFLKNKFWGEDLTLAVDVHLGFNDEPGNTKQPRISFGMDYRPKYYVPIPIRLGMSFGGREGFGYAFGTGISMADWDLDFATETLVALFSPKATRELSFTLGYRVRL
ncbi:MAG: hypothetical protein EXR24_06310 [Ignavibacteria bacterium]|nr:hypothetical protein [Bacteroidota bacterium]MSQ46572.1 hypothetical protein [Ignavibacteria bacterium]